MTFKKAHQQCPDCGSSDALGVNDDGSTKCFSCGVYRPSERLEGSAATSVSERVKKPLRTPPDAFAAGFEERGISMSTASTFGVLQDSLGSAFFPYFRKDEQVGWKEEGKRRLLSGTVMPKQRGCLVNSCSEKAASTSPSLKGSWTLSQATR